MTYGIKWHPQAYKVLRKLPKDMIKRTLDKLDAVSNDPFKFLEHFEGDKLYKLRIGNYRALIDIIFEDKLILVKVFDHRSKVYK